MSMTKHDHLARLEDLDGLLKEIEASHLMSGWVAEAIAWAVKTIREQEARIAMQQKCIGELAGQDAAEVVMQQSARIAELENFIRPVPQPPQRTSQKGDAK